MALTKTLQIDVDEAMSARATVEKRSNACRLHEHEQRARAPREPNVGECDFFWRWLERVGFDEGDLGKGREVVVRARS